LIRPDFIRLVHCVSSLILFFHQQKTPQLKQTAGCWLFSICLGGCNSP